MTGLSISLWGQEDHAQVSSAVELLSGVAAVETQLEDSRRVKKEVCEASSNCQSSLMYHATFEPHHNPERKWKAEIVISI